MNPSDAVKQPGWLSSALRNPLPIPTVASPELTRAVQARVAELVRRAVDGSPGWNPPPFNPRVLARALGIEIRYKSGLGDVDALIVHRNKKFRILANADVRSLGRLNFSLAHELAHTQFDASNDRVYMRSRDRAVYSETAEGLLLERLCDLAAAELLMPEAWFRPAVETEGFNARAVLRLADRFEVSYEAAALRLLSMVTSPPMAVGFFDYSLRPSSKNCSVGLRRTPEIERYRALRFFRSDGFPYLFPLGKSVPSTSVVYRTSLRRSPLQATEEFVLGRVRAKCVVSAARIAHSFRVDGPPRVCAAFRLD